MIQNVPNLIACPTCGRTQWDMEPAVNEVESYLQTVNKDVTVAIMGCAVNGQEKQNMPTLQLQAAKRGVINQEG